MPRASDKRSDISAEIPACSFNTRDRATREIPMWLATAGAAAGIGAITFFAIHEHHAHILKGCVESSADGLQMTNEGDKRNYVLSGDTADLKVGERVRLSGHKKKANGTQRQFVVKKLAKDYGVCHATPATP